MPRGARLKSNDSVYHIMLRSISDTPLYKCNNDKEMFLHLIKKYQDTYFFKVYAYCIMDTHAHILIDSCGADISKIMHGINQCYAQYFNRTYNRRGHLFQDRFKSKIVYNDRALMAVSAYINKNSKDINGYKGREEQYPYSSFGVYAGIAKDDLHILDPYLILDQFNRNIVYAKRQYADFVRKYDENNLDNDMEFTHERAEYRSERKILFRDTSPSQVIDFVSSYIEKDKTYINVKYIKDTSEIKSLCALLMRGLCDMREKDICILMGNINQSHASRLCLNGIKLINEKDKYKNIIKDFLEQKAS